MFLFIKINLKKATTIIKIYQVLGSIALDIDDINLGDGPFSSDIAIVNLHESRGEHSVLFINQNYFTSYGCVPAQKLFKLILKQNGHCLYAELKIQGLANKKDSSCETHCFF